MTGPMIVDLMSALRSMFAGADELMVEACTTDLNLVMK